MGDSGSHLFKDQGYEYQGPDVLKTLSLYIHSASSRKNRSEGPAPVDSEAAGLAEAICSHCLAQGQTLGASEMSSYREESIRTFRAELPKRGSEVSF